MISQSPTTVKQVVLTNSSQNSNKPLSSLNNHHHHHLCHPEEQPITSPLTKIFIEDQKKISHLETNSQSHAKADKFYLYLNQVGGHSTFLKPVDERINFIVKPAQCKELEFYESTQKTKDMNRLKKFLPKYYGTVEITNSAQILMNSYRNAQEKNSSSDNIKYMKLQDLTKNKKYPCILDIKMGFKAQSKKDEIKFENSTSSQVGFRICGMNVYQPLKKCAIFKDKYWGRQINSDSLHNSVASFFCDGEKIRFNLIHRFIRQLKGLKNALQYYKGYKFYSSSLLLIYDGIYSADQFKTNTKDKNNKIQNKSNKSVPKGFKFMSFSQKKSSQVNQKSGALSQQIQRKGVNNENKPDTPKFTLENNVSDVWASYKPLLLQNLSLVRRSSAFQYQKNKISQQIQNSKEIEKKLSKNKQIPELGITNECLTQFKQRQQENGFSNQDLISLTNLINSISKPKSENSERSECSNSVDNGSIDEDVQQEEDKNDDLAQCSQSSSNNNDNSFLSQGSSSNLNESFQSNSKEGVVDSLNKSINSSYSLECISFKQSRPRSILKLIDFANIEISENINEPDQELIQGIDNLIGLLCEITKKEASISFLIENQQLFQQIECDTQKENNTYVNEIISEATIINNDNNPSQTN